MWNMTMGFIQMNVHFIYIVWALMLTSSKSGWMLSMMFVLLCWLLYVQWIKVSHIIFHCFLFTIVLSVIRSGLDAWWGSLESGMQKWRIEWLLTHSCVSLHLHLLGKTLLWWTDWLAYDCDGFGFIQVTVKIQGLFWALMLIIYWSRWMNWAGLCAYMCIELEEIQMHSTTVSVVELRRDISIRNRPLWFR